VRALFGGAGGVLLKKPGVNAALSTNATAMAICSPAASRIKGHLGPFTRGLETGRLHNRLAARLIPFYKTHGRLSLLPLAGLELQPRHALHQLTGPIYHVAQQEAAVRLHVAPGPAM
jgi:hypothetical protein